MSLWILDTDHITFFLEGHPSVTSKVAQKSPQDLAITIITVQEIFNGWAGKINDRSSTHKLVALYTKFWETTEFLKQIRVLNFDEAANLCYGKLLNQHRAFSKKGLGKESKDHIRQDLRIASIALSVEGAIVTRNTKDFSQVPGLKIENWTGQGSG